MIYSYLYTSHTVHYKLLLMTILITAWGVRLTYNFHRKGGYGNFFTHEEDHRWAVIRKYIDNKGLFLLFNITFIASYQNILLYLITLPVYDILMGPTTLNLYDYTVAILFILFLLLESFADNQQWNFHTLKSLYKSNKLNNPPREVVEGYLQSGLFKYSRHPNFFAEQAMWVCVYLYSLSDYRNLFSLSGIGCILLILLFQGSMNFTEHITESKYPSYSTYRARVSQCIPVVTWSSDSSKDD
jgi:steroid 5-alpha reductase family enzyme